ncbi:hypothetical protein ABK040_003263 [Willaertia magna]
MNSFNNKTPELLINNHMNNHIVNNNTDNNNNNYVKEQKKNQILKLIASPSNHDQFYEKVPCKYYYYDKRGCQKGSNCSFSHSSICRHYFPNNYNETFCKFGKNCKFLHQTFEETKIVRNLHITDIVNTNNNEQSNQQQETTLLQQSAQHATSLNKNKSTTMASTSSSSSSGINNSSSNLSQQQQQSVTLDWFLRKKDPFEFQEKKEIQLIHPKDEPLFINNNRKFEIKQMTSNKYHLVFSIKENNTDSIWFMNYINLNSSDNNLNNNNQSLQQQTYKLLRTFQRPSINQVLTKSGISGVFTMYLLENGKTFSNGNNPWGQLGHQNDSFKRDSFIPKPIKFNKEVKQIAIGTDHTCLLTIDNELHCVGLNESGQCGIGPQDQFLLEFKKVNLDKFLIDKNEIIKVECGDEYTVCLCKDGVVFAFGKNLHGQLGISDSTQKAVFYPTQIRSSFISTINNNNNKDKIIDIVCGSQTTAFLTKLGNVYMCGHNHYGQCGVNSKVSKIFTPTLVQLTNTIMDNNNTMNNNLFISKVFCKEHNTFFITNENRVFACGANDFELIAPIYKKKSSEKDHHFFNISTPTEITKLVYGKEEDPRIWSISSIVSNDTSLLLLFERDIKRIESFRISLIFKTKLKHQTDIDVVVN